MLCDYVSGEYQAALERFARIPADYADRDLLLEPALEASVHLREYDKALAFAQAEGAFPKHVVERLARHAARPMAVSLAGVAGVPFAEHPLAENFPGFVAEINGTKLIAHMDTGGSYIIMGPERAKALGVETAMGEESRAHLNLMRMQLAHGIADTFVLGPAALRNVPVTVLPTLTGESDYIIFGTCILEQFLTTLDYPAQRMILSPRGNDALRREHLARLPREFSLVPFYVWSDHFMFARGHFGDRRDLTFFVDSGLVILNSGEDGQVHQAAFTTSARNLRELGVSADAIRSGFFPIPSLGLGTREQTGHYAVPGSAGDGDLGGVRVDGLISHAFLKRYVWTIDFDTMEYRFSDPRQGFE
jgi:hypothetical protein